MFTTAASHLNDSTLTGKICINGCNSLGYKLSTIQSMTCFCANDLPESAIPVSNSFCMNSTCQVRSSIENNDDIYNFCGSDSSLKIYALTVYDLTVFI